MRALLDSAASACLAGGAENDGENHEDTKARRKHYVSDLHTFPFLDLQSDLTTNEQSRALIEISQKGQVM